MKTESSSSLCYLNIVLIKQEREFTQKNLISAGLMKDEAVKLHIICLSLFTFGAYQVDADWQCYQCNTMWRWYQEKYIERCDYDNEMIWPGQPWGKKMTLSHKNIHTKMHFTFFLRISYCGWTQCAQKQERFQDIPSVASFGWLGIVQ
jgi:hypothetical protein